MKINNNINNKNFPRKGKCHPKQHRWILVKKPGIFIGWRCTICGKEK